MDNIPSAYAEEAVDWAVKNGLLQGNAAGDLMLRQPVTRQQLAAILYRSQSWNGRSERRVSPGFTGSPCMSRIWRRSRSFRGRRCIFRHHWQSLNRGDRMRQAQKLSGEGPEPDAGLRIEPEKRLCPAFDPVTIATFRWRSRTRWGFRVLDNFCEEHIQ